MAINYVNVCIVNTFRLHNTDGYSLIELLFILGLSAVLLSFSSAKLTDQKADLDIAATQTAGFVRLVRARAIASTQAYIIERIDDNHLIAKFSHSCEDEASAFQVDPYLTLELSKRVRINPLTDLCLSSRGLLRWPIWLSLSYKDFSHSQSIEIGAAGSVKFRKL